MQHSEIRSSRSAALRIRPAMPVGESVLNEHAVVVPLHVFEVNSHHMLPPASGNARRPTAFFLRTLPTLLRAVVQSGKAECAQWMSNSDDIKIVSKTARTLGDAATDRR